MIHGATGLALYLSSADHKVPEFYGRASRREMLRTSDRTHRVGPAIQVLFRHLATLVQKLRSVPF
jgi:hypothetical protein